MAALYQQARPRTFAEVVGQDHVKEVLTAALRGGRTGHAYLFSGPRGVGKTTTARLLAMALNCEAAAHERPCGACESCRLVRQGAHPDVVELDAASNNSVEDVRDLREKVALASLRGGVRVWILDEAHMLSRAAANALLKTLEEPPAGLVFVLATTEPEKLPPTVLSRCQHFRFRRLGVEEIRGKLERLCRDAGVEAEESALELVARAADGAMRDAESLLERLLAARAAISRGSVEDALGLPPAFRLRRLAEALAQGDLAVLMAEAASLYRDGFAPRSLAEQLGITLRDALHAQLQGEQGLPLEQRSLLRLIHALDEEQERFVRRDDLYSLEVALIKAVNALSGNLPRLATAQAGEKGEKEEERSSSAAPPGEPVAAAAAAPPFDPHGRGPQRRPKAPAPKAPASAAAGSAERSETPGRAAPKFDWHALKAASGPQLKAFLMPGRESVDGFEVSVSYDETHRFHYSELLKRREELERLIEEKFGSGYRLRLIGPGESPKKG